MFIIPHCPRTKKNSPTFCGGKHPILLPSKAYRAYASKCKEWFTEQIVSLPYTAIDYPVNVEAHYYVDNRRRIDLGNLNNALLDILQDNGIITDDCCAVVISQDGSRVHYDKLHPRTEVTITRSEERNEWTL